MEKACKFLPVEAPGIPISIWRVAAWDATCLAIQVGLSLPCTQRTWNQSPRCSTLLDPLPHFCIVTIPVYPTKPFETWLALSQPFAQKPRLSEAKRQTEKNVETHTGACSPGCCYYRIIAASCTLQIFQKSRIPVWAINQHLSLFMKKIFSMYEADFVSMWIRVLARNASANQTMDSWIFWQSILYVLKWKREISDSYPLQYVKYQN